MTPERRRIGADRAIRNAAAWEAARVLHRDLGRAARAAEAETMRDAFLAQAKAFQPTLRSATP